jgi:hypothetical protein
MIQVFVLLMEVVLHLIIVIVIQVGLVHFVIHILVLELHQLQAMFALLMEVVIQLIIAIVIMDI